jgi:arsenate reductase
MAQRLTDDVALRLLVNAVATVAVLGALISSLAPVSGAHLNPAVTLAEAVRGRLAWGEVPAYVLAQVVGAVAGTALANLMFGLPALHVAAHERTGMGLWLGEVVATGGLVLVVGLLRDPGRAPFVVPAWILGAYFFTSSTSFANPAVTVARAFSDTFAGIAPGSVAPFVVAQLAGAAGALVLLRLLEPTAEGETTATRSEPAPVESEPV